MFRIVCEVEVVFVITQENLLINHKKSKMIIIIIIIINMGKRKIVV